MPNASLSIDGTEVISKVSGTITQTFPGPTHTFTVKAENSAITGANYNTSDNATSDQLAIYNGTTKLWGINESGWVQNPNSPKFLVRAPTTGIAAPNGGWGDITSGFTVTEYNVGNNFSTSSGFTAPISGYYYFYVGGWATPSSNGSRYAYSYELNGSTAKIYIGGGDYCTTDSPMGGYSIMYYMSAGDYAKLLMFSSIAATLGTTSHSFYTGGYLIG